MGGKWEIFSNSTLMQSAHPIWIRAFHCASKYIYIRSEPYRNAQSWSSGLDWPEALCEEIFATAKSIVNFTQIIVYSKIVQQNEELKLNKFTQLFRPNNACHSLPLNYWLHPRTFGCLPFHYLFSVQNLSFNPEVHLAGIIIARHRYDVLIFNNVFDAHLSELIHSLGVREFNPSAAR